jgi:hypothetical protein
LSSWQRFSDRAFRVAGVEVIAAQASVAATWDLIAQVKAATAPVDLFIRVLYSSKAFLAQ